MKWIVLAYSVLTLSVSACSESSRDTPLGRLSVMAPDTVQAGNTLPLHFWASGMQPGDKVEVAISNSWETTVVEHSVESDTFVIPVPLGLTRATGLLDVTAYQHGRKLTQRTVQIIPRNPAPPLELFLGSKSIVADEQHWSMIIALPTDAYDNPVADSTPVNYRLLRPDGNLEEHQVLTRYLLSHHKIRSGTIAGKTLVSTHVEKVQGREKQLLEVAGPAQNFSIQTDGRVPFADERQLFQLKTSVIKDAFGNTVSDGTLVEFYGKDPDGTQRIAQAYTILGIAAVTLENPASVGTMTLWASVPEAGRSNTLSLLFIATKGLGQKIE